LKFIFGFENSLEETYFVRYGVAAVWR